MNGLYLIGQSQPFTRLVRITPQQDTTRITNRTLDGKYHVQILGEPARTLIIEVAITNEGRLILEGLNANGGLFKVVDDGAIYEVRILDLGEFAKPIRGLYQTTLVVA